MEPITLSVIRVTLHLFKNPNRDYNANNLAKELKLSSMGVLKIAKRLEKENVLLAKEMGKAKFYSFNLDDEYAKQYLKFLFKWEAQHANPYIKLWITEIKKLKHAHAAILFGSVLHKYKESRDIDVLLITNDKGFAKLKKEVEEVNFINVKKIHPIYQTEPDLKENIANNDPVIANALKGIIVSGEDVILGCIEKWHKRKIR